jgi:hypothetical protein
MFLKGPTDMLTLYENRYKTELQKFAAMQVGRRRRDDYTDGTIRIPNRVTASVTGDKIL